MTRGCWSGKNTGDKNWRGCKHNGTEHSSREGTVGVIEKREIFHVISSNVILFRDSHWIFTARFSV